MTITAARPLRRRTARRRRRGWALAALLTLVVACTSGQAAGPLSQVTTVPAGDVAAGQPDGATPTPTPTPTPPAAPVAAPTTGAASPTGAAPTPTARPTSAAPAGHPPLPPGVSRPSWLGTIPLEVGPDGVALAAPTPPELVVRRIPTIDLLPPPVDGRYHATISELTPEIIARSTWTPECPVTTEELRYLTMSFWGFDERAHTGEMIVNAAWADEVTEIFRGLFEARYPIEEMRVVSAEELDGIPTGDTNDTTGFVCRPVRGASSWSQHAYGLAVDVNPFLNPYRSGERILPELAGAYLDRDHVRPGMLFEGDQVVSSFDAIGWGWGGRWSSLIDWMHFSANGR